MARKADKPKPGPAPERFKIDGMDWKQAVKLGLNKPKPAGGWPEPPGKKKRKSPRTKGR